jgi:radical SAM protein with 4Fe4S-binding SPASM domain
MRFLDELRTRIPFSRGPRGDAPAGNTFPQLPGAGVYHYLRETAESKARIHLRLESDGRGLLLVNASRAFHLNPSAACMAYFNLEGHSEETIVQALARYFRVTKANARRDYQAFAGQMAVMTSPDEHCPICELDLETTAPFSDHPSAPYRMDLALTYRCNNACAHCYNARPRQHPEISTGQWINILDRLWEIGVPHIVFTGGEPTLRPDLPELIAHAEANGQITGINTNGRRLKDKAFLQSLVDAGLDHAQITIESHDPAIHDAMVHGSGASCAAGAWEDTLAGLKNVLSTRLYVMTNTTLLRLNAPYLSQTLDFLADLGVPTVGLNALIYSGRGLEVDTGIPEADLPPLLDLARAATTRRGQRLVWYTPTQYCHFDPIQLELGVKGCTAALYNMCVEPDGSVIPCQSYYQAIGNVLLDPWESIWNHELAVALRERHNLPIECRACALLIECGGGCPLARQANPHLRPRTIYADIPGLHNQPNPWNTPQVESPTEEEL